MSTALAFATLFLGLVSGPYEVELRASASVQAIEFVLDGRPVRRLSRPPWRTVIDFGPGLRPHELVASAADGAGRFLGETRQLVNVSRPPAEIALLVERDERGEPRSARLVWGTVGAPKGATVELLLDGHPLRLGTDQSAALPSLDLTQPHLLTARVSLGPAIGARYDAVLGGEVQESTGSHLTGVLVSVPAGAPEPSAAELARGLRIGDSSPRAVALERGESAVFFVSDPSGRAARRALAGIRRASEKITLSMREVRVVSSDSQYRRYETRLGREDRFRFLWPLASAARGAALPTRLFDASREFGFADGGLLWFFTEVRHPAPRPGEERWADAVAVAGLQALSTQKRRAVVLVLGDEPSDGSQYDPPAVRQYLESIRVPLFLWSLERRPSTLAHSWGLPVVDVSSSDRLRRAAKELERALERQRILWIPGLHLPTAITSSTEAADLTPSARSD
jgi:hypothetical protein